MSSDVVLTAALRNNLLSLQGTQKSIDATQIRLSTGKKVNSALDNPQSFFASKALANRADDLSKLLDSIGQSIQVIKAADTGVTALTSLINQAQSLATSAQDQLSGASTTAKVSGTTTLDADTKLSNISGFAASGDKLILTVTDPSNPGTTNPVAAVTITTQANDTVADLITRINDQNTSLTTPAIKAALDSNGHFTLEAVNGGTLSVQFQNNGAVTDAASLAVAGALGLSSIATVNTNGNGTTGNITGFTVRSSAIVSSNALYAFGATGTLANSATLFANLADSSNVKLTNITVATDTFKIKVGGKTSADLFNQTPPGGAALTALTSTVGSVVDAINRDSNINSLVSASFDATTGKIILTAKDATATDLQIQFTSVGAGQTFSVSTTAYKNGLGFGTNVTSTAAVGLATQETIRFGAAAGTLAGLQTQYNNTLSQIDALVSNGDTGYRGTNLLNGDNLITTFNESRTSSLTTTGVRFTSASLGLTTGTFNSASSVASSLTQISDALTTVRNFGSSIANDLATIQTRQDFTTSLINTLNAGADLLVNADQNEEGAKLLALQTRQQLGVTALSLASQSQQSILRLF